MIIIILILKDVKFISTREWIITVIDFKTQLAFAFFYYVLRIVPTNQHGFIKRFSIGAAIGLVNVAALTLILKRDVALYRKSLYDKA